MRKIAPFPTTRQARKDALELVEIRETMRELDEEMGPTDPSFVFTAEDILAARKKRRHPSVRWWLVYRLRDLATWLSKF